MCDIGKCTTPPTHFIVSDSVRREVCTPHHDMAQELAKFGFRLNDSGPLFTGPRSIPQATFQEAEYAMCAADGVEHTGHPPTWPGYIDRKHDDA